MTIRTLLLFIHVSGTLALFIGLALELVSIESLRRVGSRDESSLSLRVMRALPRFYGIAFALILLSGIVLASRVGVHKFAWVRLALASMVLMGVAGAMVRSRMRAIASAESAEALRRYAADTLLRVSIRTRIALGLAVVFLMIAKADLITSLTAIGVALLGGIIASIQRPVMQKEQPGVHTW
jgi:hypothetical protein